MGLQIDIMNGDGDVPPFTATLPSPSSEELRAFHNYKQALRSAKSAERTCISIMDAALDHKDGDMLSAIRVSSAAFMSMNDALKELDEVLLKANWS